MLHIREATRGCDAHRTVLTQSRQPLQLIGIVDAGHGRRLPPRWLIRVQEGTHVGAVLLGQRGDGRDHQVLVLALQEGLQQQRMVHIQSRRGGDGRHLDRPRGVLQQGLQGGDEGRVRVDADGPGAGGKAMNFGKSKARLLSDSGRRVTFDDVSGVDEAKEELEEIIQFLKDPRKFTRLGGRIPKGVLLMGPPGTGKTLLARAGVGPTTVQIGNCGLFDASLSTPITQLPRATADGNGIASLSLNVPPGLSGMPVWVQAFDFGSCSLSNGATLIIQ